MSPSLGIGPDGLSTLAPLFADSARFRPGPSRVALDPGGRVVSLVLFEEFPADTETNGFRTGRSPAPADRLAPAARRPGPVPADVWFILRSVTRQLPRSPR